jgi:uncharacterized repeat protein (TIGR02543 family)
MTRTYFIGKNKKHFREIVSVEFIIFTIYTMTLLFGNHTFATDTDTTFSKSSSPDFFISPDGNDNNNGTSSLTPWRTLQKVNSSNFPKGSVIAFERGGEWYGQLKVPTSDITITSYGNGENPVIHGWKTLSGWKSEGNGLYSLIDNSLPSDIKLLTINGTIKRRGRFPKSGWWVYSSGSGNQTGSISSNSLSGQPNFSGGQIVLSKNAWVIDVATISSHSGVTINYNGASKSAVNNGYGFFIQNHIACLSEFGDWMYNGSTKKLTMYFGPDSPNSITVKVSSIETLISSENKGNITIEHLSLEGSNGNMINLESSSTVNNFIIQNCNIRKSGRDGINADSNIHNITLQNSVIEDTQNNGIYATASNVDVLNNTFRRNYIDPGSGQNGNHKGVTIALNTWGWNGRRGYNIIGNRIYESGYHAIRYAGSDILIEKNYIYKYNITAVDGGGIYTYGYGAELTTNKIVRYNIVLNPDFVMPVVKPSPTEETFGIYFDNYTDNVVCEYNIIGYAWVGAYFHESSNITFQNNIIFKSRSNALDYRDANNNKIQNINNQFNKVYVLSGKRALWTQRRNTADINNFGIIDNNYYINPSEGVYVRKHFDSLFDDLTLAQWRSKYKFDINTKTSPTKSSVADLYYNDSHQTKTINVGKNRIDIDGKPITNPLISFEPFTGMIVLEGEPSVSDPDDKSWIINSSTTGQGSITKSPDKSQYENNESVQLTAVPQLGWEFAGWIGDLSGTTNPVQITLTKNISITATFSEVSDLEQYNITLSINSDTVINPSEIVGSITGGGTYTNGQTANLSATPNTGYSFSNWTEGNTIISSQPNYSFTVTKDRNLVANFILNKYIISITANPSIGGNFSGGGTFRHGQTVNLSATPNKTGYTFANWTEGGTVVSTNVDFSFIANSDRNLVANFTPNNYTIEVNANPLAGGNVTGGGTYNHGQSINLIATPNLGYSFVNWTENGTVLSTQSSFSFNALTDRILVANFIKESYTLSLESNPIDGGFLDGSGQYSYGDSVSVSANPNQGFVFHNWTENNIVVSTNSQFKLTINNNRTLIANFEEERYLVSLSVNPENAGTVLGAGNYPYGETIIIMAMPNDGYTFKSWTENGEVISTDVAYSIEITEERNIIANFESIIYNLELAANPTNGGLVSGGGSYKYNEIASLKVNPNVNYDFKYWSSGDSILSYDPEFNYSVINSAFIVAHFELSESLKNISVTAMPSGYGFVSGNGIYPSGQEAHIVANPLDANFVFTGWYENGIQISNDPIYTFRVIEGRELVANFEYYAPILKVEANIEEVELEEICAIYGDGEYPFGDLAVLEVVIPKNVQFIGWANPAGQIVSRLNPFVFEVNRNIKLHPKLEFTTNNLPKVHLYPNPSNGIFWISAENIRNLKIYDSNGILVQEEHNIYDNKAFNAEKLPSGLYMVKFMSENDVYSLKLLIN